jgi:hypothetical protein
MKLGTCAAMAWVVALTAQSAIAQSIYLEFAPQAGTVWDVTQTRTQIKSEGATPIESDMTAKIAVIDETDDGYVMEWTTNTLSVGGYVIRDQPEALVGVPIRFDTDFDGVPVRLHDLGFILDAVEALSVTVGNEEAAQRARTMFEAMAPDDAAGLLTSDASLIMQCHNFDLEPGVMLEGSFEAGSPVGGPPILTHSKIIMEDAGDLARPARIQIEQWLDPESGATALYEAVKSLAGEAEAEAMLENGKLPKLESNLRTTCHVDVTSGVTVRVDTDREIRAPTRYSRDTRTLTMTPR